MGGQRRGLELSMGILGWRYNVQFALGVQLLSRLVEEGSIDGDNGSLL